VGKTPEEIREALGAGVLMLNVESEAELELLAREAARLGHPASAAIRVNPDVAAGGHPHISTGYHLHKFGVDWSDARGMYRAWKGSRWIEWRGISTHIGSQILSAAPFGRAVRRLASCVGELHREGIDLRYFDFGGGMGIRYGRESPLTVREYARTITAAVRPLGCHLLLEPGRVLVGPAGVLLMRVSHTKGTRGKNFIVVDAGMNDFMRPAIYGAIHPITKAEIRNSKFDTWLRTRPEYRVSSFESPSARLVGHQRADIVGPVCETSDCFLHDWPIEDVNEGDLLVLWGAGAYGYVSATNYNSRRRPPEVLVEGNRFRLIRRRESFADLTRGEIF
jgi:diaminopimelate decarboxylase